MTAMMRSPRAAGPAAVLFPEKKPAAKCDHVGSGPAVKRQPVQLGDIPANDDVIELESGDERGDNLVDAFAPFRFRGLASQRR
jgi:hypothetical protein